MARGSEVTKHENQARSVQKPSDSAEALNPFTFMKGTLWEAFMS